MPIRRVTLPWDKYNDGAYNAGDGAYNLLRQLGSKAKGIACSVYRNQPGALVPNPASNLLAGFWDNVCSDDPDGLPPPPASPFTGGQCEGEQYNVRFTYETYGCCGPNASRQERVDNYTVWGPVYSVSMGVRIKPSQTAESYNVVISHGTSQTDPTPTEKLGTHGTPLAYNTPIPELLTVSVTPTGGGVDVCGDPPREYPPPPPYTPPSGDIIIQPRPNIPDFTIAVPFFWIDADFNLDVKPYIDVGGIKISFDLGGITFEYNPDTAPSPLPDTNPLPRTFFPPRPVPPPIEFPPPPDLTPDFDRINDDFNDIRDRLENPPPPPPPPPVEIQIPVGSCDTSTFTYHETTTTVTVEPSLIPVVYGEARSQADSIKEACKPSDEDSDCVSAIPEWWQTVIGGDRPQLIAIFRREGTRTYYQLAIPHPSSTLPVDTPLISEYRAGDYMGMITLRDNSKFICYAFDEDTANRILDEATSLISPGMLFSPSRRKISKTNGYGIAQDLRKPSKNAYFAEGNRLLAPTWERKIKGVIEV